MGHKQDRARPRRSPRDQGALRLALTRLSGEVTSAGRAVSLRRVQRTAGEVDRTPGGGARARDQGSKTPRAPEAGPVDGQAPDQGWSEPSSLRGKQGRDDWSWTRVPVIPARAPGVGPARMVVRFSHLRTSTNLYLQGDQPQQPPSRAAAGGLGPPERSSSKPRKRDAQEGAGDHPRVRQRAVEARPG